MTNYRAGVVAPNDPASGAYVQTAPSAPPLVYGSPLDGTLPDPPAPLHWRTYALPKTDPDYSIAIGFELRIDDLRGGYMQSGDFARGANQYDGDYRMTSSSAGVDSRFRRHLTLSQFKTNTNVTSPGTENVFWTMLNGVLVMGGGLTANQSLFTESSNAPAAVTYTPANRIIALHSAVIGGATTAERLLVCMNGSAIDVHSVAGTSLGSMHANTTTTWGVLTTPINAATPGTPQLLIYANNSIYTLPVSSAIGTAPTQVLSGLPNGGYALGIEQVPKSWPLRAYWVMPTQNRSSSFAPVTTYQMRVYSTNLEGTDRQLVPLPLTSVWWSGLWRRMVVACDTARIVTWDGDQSRDLHVLDNRTPSGAIKKGISGLIINDNDLYAVIVYQGGTQFGIEQYLPEFDSWLQVSAFWVPATQSSVADGGPYTLPVQMHSYSPTIPVSAASGRAYVSMLNGTWNHQFLAPSGHNPYYLYRATDATTTYARQFESTGYWISPYYLLPTLEGRSKKIDQVVFGGEVAEGSVQLTINPNQGGTAVTWAGTDTTRSQQVPGSSALFDLLQLKITLNQGSSTYKTPQALPITIRGRAYLTDADAAVLGLPSGGF